MHARCLEAVDRDTIGRNRQPKLKQTDENLDEAASPA